MLELILFAIFIVIFKIGLEISEIKDVMEESNKIARESQSTKYLKKDE